MRTYRFHKILNAQVVRAKLVDSVVIGAAEKVSFTNAIVSKAKLTNANITNCTLTNTLFQNGTASQPSLSFINDPDTGLFYNPLFPNTFSFALGGQESFRFSSTSIAAPSGSAGAPAYSFTNNTSNGLYAASANELSFSMSGTRTMSIFSDRVEFVNLLRVGSGSASTPSYSFTSQTNAGMYLSSTNTIGFSTVATARAFISSASWGLSTTLIPQTNGNLDIGTDALAFGRVYTTALNCGAFRPLNDNTDRLTLSTSTLTCNVSVRPNASQTHNLGGTSNRWNNCYLNNAPDVGSDVRLKKNIEDLDYGMETIELLKPKQFEYIEDTEEKTRFGFLAQDLLQVFSDVQKPSFITGNGSDEYYGIDVTALIPVLVRAIQDLHQEVEFLRSQLNL